MNKTILVILILSINICVFAQNEIKIPPRGYKGKRFNQIGNDISSKYIQHDKIGLPLKGFIVDNFGNKIEHVIAYQEPEKLLANEFDLAICKEATGKKVDVLNPSSEPNFGSWLKKEGILAFYVGEQLFVKRNNKWYIMITEGAISELVSLTKITSNGVTSYQCSELLQKINQEPINVAGLSLGFKNTMSSMTHEYKELSENIKKKVNGYKWFDLDKIRTEYNEWYSKNYPNNINYIMPYEYSIKVYSMDDFKLLINKALLEKSADILAGLMAYEINIKNTIVSKTTNEQYKKENLAIKQNYNVTMYNKNMETYNKILSDWSNTDYNKIKMADFKYTDNNERTSKLGFDYGQCELLFFLDQVPYQINFGKVINTIEGWKFIEIYIAQIDYYPTNTNEEVAAEPPRPSRADLPVKFSKLPGKWEFFKLFDGDKDITSKYSKGFINGKPITMEIKIDGELIYQQELKEKLNTVSAEWEYLTEDNREEREKEHDLKITLYKTDGGQGSEKYKLVSVSETELIYEHVGAKFKFVYKRIN